MLREKYHTNRMIANTPLFLCSRVLVSQNQSFFSENDIEKLMIFLKIYFSEFY